MEKCLIKELEARGFIQQKTSGELASLLQKEQTVYIGFDPTADSLHLGSLVGIIALGWFQKYGHKVVGLVGGATGLIGDPSGKSIERPALDKEAVNKNLAGIEKNLASLLDKEGKHKLKLINNIEWYESLSFLDFLKDVAAQVRMSPLLARDTVKKRLATEEGMSFKEFSYPLLQAYDFYKLNKQHNVTIQIGGADQWTNITAGIDLTRRLNQKEVFGITFPLLVKSDGKKFGKSESGAIWLSKEKLSVYNFYQHLIRVSDKDVIFLLKMLTFLEISEIESLEQSMKKTDYVPNSVQKVLAKEVTCWVHGEDELQIALNVTKSMKPGAKTELNVALLKEMANDLPHLERKIDQILDQKLVDVLFDAELFSSKGEARKSIKGGGVYINNERAVDEKMVLKISNLVEGECLLIAVGKKKKVVIFIKG